MLADNFFAGILNGPASRVAYSVNLPTNYYSCSCVANLINGTKTEDVEDATISYDREKTLPTFVHDELIPTEASVDAGESVDLKLLQERA
jgi:hypothetical protein